MTTIPRFPNGLPDLLAGVYRHYKGGLYQVLGYARDSTNGRDEPRVVVVYVGLQVPGVQLPGETSSMRMMVRDAGQFHDFVHIDDGDVCDVRWPPGYMTTWCDAHKKIVSPRFRYLDVEAPCADH